MSVQLKPFDWTLNNKQHTDQDTDQVLYMEKKL